MSPRLLGVVALFALAACGDQASPTTDGGVAARVGDAVLTDADLADALGEVHTGVDSVTARDQVVEQWVQRELLVQQARSQGLDDDPGVRRLIDESERATLEAAALDAFFAQSPETPSDADLQAYYQANRDALALREPYVRMRHLRVADRARAGQARSALARALTSQYPDSLFALVAQEYADDPAGSQAQANEFVSESRLRSLDAVLGERVAALPAGAQVDVVPVGRTFHVVQVVDRVPAGTVPPFRLLRDELADRLAVQRRRDAQARLIQRLRSEAQARGDLDF